MDDLDQLLVEALTEEVVCGLHVEYNLQVLPESVHRWKGNRF